MATQLQDYLYDLRRLLRDSQAQFWDDAQLIRDINKARDDLVRDTLCTRGLCTITLNQGQEAYQFSAVLSALQAAGFPAKDVMGILGISVLWGTNIKNALDYLPFEDFNASYRVMPNFRQVPVCWSFLGSQTFYVGPVPNQNYSADVSCVWLANGLVNYTDPETALVNPYIDLVPLRAMYWAKYYERAFSEATLIRQQYEDELNAKLGVTPAFRVPSRYASLNPP